MHCYVVNLRAEDKSRKEWVRFANISGFVCVESDVLILAIHSSLCLF